MFLLANWEIFLIHHKLNTHYTSNVNESRIRKDCCNKNKESFFVV